MLSIDKTDRKSIVNSLEFIANELILHHAIRVNESVFFIIDVEVYYYHPCHPDEYAFGIEHNRPFGEFEAHRYGLDFSLGNKKGEDYGGILIYGIQDTETKELFFKLKVFHKIFNALHIGENAIELVSHQNRWNEVIRSKRMKLGNPVTENKKEFFDAPYKFLANDTSIFASYKGKEEVLNNADIKLDEKEKLLGYKLKQ